MLNLERKKLAVIMLVVFFVLFMAGDSILAATCVNGACDNGTGLCESDADCDGSGAGEPFKPIIRPVIPTEGLPGFGQLIALIFTWSLNILGIVVFVMVFFAGFKWFTAAGNTAKVNEAKDQITNAVLGAIILLAAYIILYTINPDLVGGMFTLPGIGGSAN